MKYHARLVPEAVAELAEAALRFDAFEPFLGDRVMAQWQRSLQRILRYPFSSPEFHRSTRKVLIRPYHLHVVYQVIEDEVRVLMVYDARRDPDVVRGLLDNRMEDRPT